MYTIEAAYVFGIAMLCILTLVNGSIRLHQKVVGYAREAMVQEIRSHTQDQEKEMFRPEEMIRAVTIFQRGGSGAEGGGE